MRVASIHLLILSLNTSELGVSSTLAKLSLCQEALLRNLGRQPVVFFSIQLSDEPVVGSIVARDELLDQCSDLSVGVQYYGQKLDLRVLELSHIQNKEDQRILLLVACSTDASHEDLKQDAVHRFSHEAEYDQQAI